MFAIPVSANDPRYRSSDLPLTFPPSCELDAGQDRGIRSNDATIAQDRYNLAIEGWEWGKTSILIVFPLLSILHYVATRNVRS